MLNQIVIMGRIKGGMNFAYMDGRRNFYSSC